jgi:ribonuclease Z
MAVYGGPGVERVVAGFAEAYAQDQGYRTVHHGPGIADPATWPMAAHPILLNGPETAARSRTATVLKDGALTITAIELDHGPVKPAYAYRFDYKGRSVVVSGDTVAHGPLATASKGTDLFVAEALARPMVKAFENASREAGRTRLAKIMGDIQSYHAGPTEMAELANRADARMLVLYHLIPAPDNAIMRRIFTRGMDKARRGAWTMADDGSLYTLPLGSHEVRVGRVAE